VYCERKRRRDDAEEKKKKKTRKKEANLELIQHFKDRVHFVHLQHLLHKGVNFGRFVQTRGGLDRLNKTTRSFTHTHTKRGKVWRLPESRQFPRQSPHPPQLRGDKKRKKKIKE